MRHRIPHFQHIMGGYAAGYYSYLWSEVMDADAFQAFERTATCSTQARPRLHDHIYSAGGKRDAAEAYKAFRGRLPRPMRCWRKRGIVASAEVLKRNSSIRLGTCVGLMEQRQAVRGFPSLVGRG
jgi:peptidyl-dipeptidase Dcp